MLYASPIVDNIQDGNFQRYSLTLGEVLALPWRLWGDNLRFIAEAAGAYLGWPLSLAALAGLALAARPGQRGLRLAALWSLVPLLLFVLTAKLIYSRYFVFCFVLLLIPAGAAVLELLRLTRAWAERRSPPLPRTISYGALGVLGLLLAAPGVGFALPLLTDPARAPWMNDRRYITDRFQYVESNYAGYGLPEIVGYLRERAKRGPVVVLARDTTGMPRDGMTAYLQEWPNVAVGFVPERETIEEGLRRRPDAAYRLAVQGADVYYLLSDAPGGEQERRFRSLNPRGQPRPGPPQAGEPQPLPALPDPLGRRPRRRLPRPPPALRGLDGPAGIPPLHYKPPPRGDPDPDPVLGGRRATPAGFHRL